MKLWKIVQYQYSIWRVSSTPSFVQLVLSKLPERSHVYQTKC